MKLSLPLRVILARKNKKDVAFILNLNNYRRAHYMVLDDAKKRYTALVRGLVWEMYGTKYTLQGRQQFRYTLFPSGSRILDIMNPISIIDKFTADALQTLGVISNDNLNVIGRVVCEFGGFDKANPRCELEIVPLEE